MNVKELTRKVLFFFQIFILPKKSFKKPKYHDIVLYDFTCPSTLLSYLSNYNFCILHLRGEEINWNVLIRIILKKQFWFGDPILLYAISFIKLVNPRIVLTYVDNSPRFYELNAALPKIKTICIQNGARSILGDMFDGFIRKNHYKVDYFFVHNINIGEKFSESIDTVAIPHGSFLLNSLSLNNSVMPGRVTFISQIRERFESDSVMFYRSRNLPIYFEEFYQAEIFNLRILNKWCKINSKDLIIVGCSTKNKRAEKAFFSRTLGDLDLTFIPKSDEFSSYNLIQSSEIVVFIDSTLGYESYGLQKKTACFSNRVTKNGIKNPFGWPANFDENGLFWTNEQNEKEIIKILNFINNISEQDWSDTLNRFKPKIMEYDSGNSKLSKLINKLLENSRL